MGRTGTVAFNDSHTALIAGWIAAVGIQGACGLCLIESAVWIVRLHAVGVLGADAVDYRIDVVETETAVVLRLQCAGKFRIDRNVSAVQAFSRLEQGLVVIAG